jgi:hypothetical protein
MTEESIHSVESLIPPSPIPTCAQEFSERVHGLLDGQPKDDATVAQAFDGFDDMFDHIAAGMYSMASMLVGEGEDSIRILETAVATAELSHCDDLTESRRNSRLALCGAALDTLTARDASSLAAPEGLEHAVTCLQDDELDSVGVTTQELEHMLAGPDRDRVRNWLESLPVVLRTIFVLRAVAGFSPTDTASLLQAHGGPQASGWTADSVRELFRQGLCSLASQVLHAAVR